MYGKHLKELREKKGISQECVATKLNLSRQAISRWENDRAFPDIDNLVALSEIYEVSLDELVGKVENIQIKEKKVNIKDREKNFYENDIRAFIMIGITICSCFVFPIGIITSIIFLYKSKELKTRVLIWMVRSVCLIVLLFCIYNGCVIFNSIFSEGYSNVEYLG